ncbi:hypothetical protein [Shewanella salipaludis]|uniref:Lipoprotein n=1 Tax=Shewanella salipaludis TaxID=2723052 RepID=A0A972FRS2_9GAMM|nr:hypothetical protein [Shewanella salipaludis]NMH64945.1 hypothetical protein [Shewanella salipaludis]
MKLPKFRTGITGILLCTVTACVNIPPEAPALSTELGKRLVAIEAAHLTLLQKYFEQKRQQIDSFIDKEWVPTFAAEFFATPAIAAAWNTLVQENDPNQRLAFIVKLGPKLVARINQKRAELIDPIDALERSVEAKIRADYTQAKALNNSIGSFLLSAAEVAENRDRYLAMAGVPEAKVDKLIDNTDEAISDLLSKTQNAQQKADAAVQYLEKLKAIRNSL